jgi:CheY-like chemotaxis protein
MIPFLFLLFSLGAGVALYSSGFAIVLVAFVVASPLIFAFLMYKDIKEIQNENLKMLDDVDADNLTAAPQVPPDSFTSSHEPRLDRSEPSTRTVNQLPVTYPMPAAPTLAALTAPTQNAIDIKNAEREISTLQTAQMLTLLETMPYNNSHHADFKLEDGKWAFRFKLNSPRAKFSAGGLGDTPTEAFLVAKQVIQKQIREWHEARIKNLTYDATTNEDLLLKIATAAKDAFKPPVVMIVDDDVDTAMGIEMIFRQLGCITHIVTNPNDLHRKISMGDADFIVLDWMLSEKIQAGQVVEKAVRVIDSFSDLKQKFELAQPKIITHSVLGKNSITIPENHYFKHLDHWQKPISHYELTTRTSELLAAAGF